MRFLAHALAFLAPAVFALAAESGPVELFNGKNFDGLHVYVSEPDLKVEQAWKIEDGLLRCSGLGRGYVRTLFPHADYTLRFEWRWPKERGNSGVIVHLVNRDEVWPKGIEVQLATDRAGDLGFYYDARSVEERIGRNPRGVSTGRLARSGPSLEKPLGEWNVLEVTASGDTLIVAVNGTEVNRTTGVKPSAGMIGFQAEGAPIDFRNITLASLPPAKDLNAPMTR